jgi:hypothetical protein
MQLLLKYGAGSRLPRDRLSSPETGRRLRQLSRPYHSHASIPIVSVMTEGHVTLSGDKVTSWLNNLGPQYTANGPNSAKWPRLVTGALNGHPGSASREPSNFSWARCR